MCSAPVVESKNNFTINCSVKIDYRERDCANLSKNEISRGSLREGFPDINYYGVEI